MDQPFTAAPSHDILLLLVQIAVLLLTARLLGEIAGRLGQPSVIGEILAGILLGPSLLSGFIPFVHDLVLPQTPTGGYLLETVSMFGSMFLLLITGLETDLNLIRQHARTAIGVSLSGVVLTFLCGFLLGSLLPGSLLANADQRTVFALFVAVAMSISSIPVIAKVLMDLNLTRRDMGQTITAAAMIDDTVGWMLLSIVTGMAGGAAITANGVFAALGSVIFFLVVSFTVGQVIVRRSLDFTQNHIKSRDHILSLIVILMVTWSALTQALNLEAVLGAFMMGILFSQFGRLSDDVKHRLESVALGIFAPIFFAVAGLKVNILNLLRPDLLLVTILVITVATFGKVMGAYLGARVIGGRDHWTALCFGAGLNAQGAMGIIIATIGLSLHILSQDMFSILVVMSISTALIAPLTLRWTFGYVQAEEQELARLHREELSRENLIAHVHRVLLPVRPRGDGSSATIRTIEARLLEQIARKTNIAVTLFSVIENVDSQEATTAFLQNLSKLFTLNEVSYKVILAQNPLVAILEESQKDYDLLVMGTPPEQHDSKVLFSPLADTLIRESPCPTVLVHSNTALQEDWRPRCILVPTNGSIAAKRAAEVGFSLAVEGDEQIRFLQVVETRELPFFRRLNRPVLDRPKVVAQQIVDDLVHMGEAFGVQAHGEVQIHRQPDLAILEVARRESIELIILGTNVRMGSNHLYLGPRVEHILQGAPCPVVIVNTP